MSRLLSLLCCAALMAVASSSFYAQESPASEPPQEEPKQAPPEKTDEPAQEQEPAADESKTPVPQVDESQTAEEMLRRLQEQKPARKAIPSATMLREETSPGEAKAGGSLLPEGDLVSRRPGRVVREGEWWTFVFESDHPERPEPRLRLLPNSVLEQMVRYVESQTDAVFVVSGEVTTFLGENYLLARIAMRQLESGNLSK
jgi:outer membrane biosynthesis protein TonB